MLISHLSLALLVGTMVSGQDLRPKALVYRGPAACEGYPEAVASLLRSSSCDFDVKFVGAREDIDVNAATLQGIDLYAPPGGGGRFLYCVSSRAK
jgi:hypothetical protein